VISEVVAVAYCEIKLQESSFLCRFPALLLPDLDMQCPCMP